MMSTFIYAVVYPYTHIFICIFLLHFYFYNIGMHRVTMPHIKRKVHFVIMASVFDTPQPIHRIYDLKGSLVGREATQEERAKGTCM